MVDGEACELEEKGESLILIFHNGNGEKMTKWAKHSVYV